MLSRALSDMTCGVRRRWRELAGELTARSRRDGYTDPRIRARFGADLRHQGQASELTIPFRMPATACRAARRLFAEYLKYLRLSRRKPDRTGQDQIDRAGSARADGSISAPIQIEARSAAKSDNQRAISARARRAGGVRAGREPRPIWRRRTAAGPLVIEEFDATIVVPAGAAVHRDRIGHVVIEFGAEP